MNKLSFRLKYDFFLFEWGTAKFCLFNNSKYEYYKASTFIYMLSICTYTYHSRL